MEAHKLPPSNKTNKDQKVVFLVFSVRNPTNLKPTSKP